MTQRQQGQIRQALELRVAVLQARVEDMVFRLEAMPDEADFANQVMCHSLELALRERERLQLHETLGALARIGSHDFGRCEECGSDISTARLVAKPSATLCVLCQEEREFRLSACA